MKVLSVERFSSLINEIAEGFKSFTLERNHALAAFVLGANPSFANDALILSINFFAILYLSQIPNSFSVMI